MSRRWEAGQEFELEGIPFRVVAGKKHDDDLRLDHFAGRWLPTGMGMGFMLADFWFENEEAMAVLYPEHVRRGAFRGGRMYLEACRAATQTGYLAQIAKLSDQKERARGLLTPVVEVGTDACPHGNGSPDDCNWCWKEGRRGVSAI